METTQPIYSNEEFSRRGKDIYERDIRPRWQDIGLMIEGVDGGNVLKVGM